MTKYKIFALVTALTAGLDLFTKWLVEARLELYGMVPVIPNFFSLTYVKNTGAAFSILSNAGAVRVPLLVGISIAAMALMVWMVKGQEEGEKKIPLYLGLIMGGALGNLVDRIRYGAVVDFLLVYYKSWQWPAFNVADSAICVGVGLILLSEILKARKPQSQN